MRRLTQKGTPRTAAQKASQQANQIPLGGLPIERRGIAWTQAETQAQLRLTQEWLLDNASHARILERLRQEWPQVSRLRCDKLITRVENAWREEGERHRAADRENAIARQRQLIIRARVDFAIPTFPAGHPQQGQPSCSIEMIARLNALKHACIQKCEQEISRLQGTYAPEKLDVDISANVAAINVVTSLTPEQIADMRARRAQLEEHATAYRRLNGHSNGATKK